jgi:hypothetical protein
MDQAGLYALPLNGNDFTITTAGTLLGDWIHGLDGMLSATVQRDFRAGTGGTDVRAYLQTSLDWGNTPIDSASFLFTGSSRQVINLSTTASVAATPATDGTLTDGQVLNGVLGDRLRVTVVSTGTWSNTLLAVRAAVR